MELRNGGLEPLVVYDQILFIWVVALDQVLVRNIALVFLVGHNKLFKCVTVQQLWGTTAISCSFNGYQSFT